MLMKSDEFQPAPPASGSIVAKYLKRTLGLLLVAALVGVVSYAIWMPEQVQQVLTGRGKDGQGQGKGRKGGGLGGDFRIPVLAAPLKLTDVPVILDGVGTARALQSVTVKPQIDGKIMRIAFKEGQDINAGDLIAEIDASIYKAQVEQLVAKRALTQTQLDNAKRDIERYLKIPGVIPQKTVDTQRALVEQLEAQIKADTAAINSAEAQLGYTRITAPIAGRAGMRLVDEGNLVRSGDAGIVVITQVQPISVLFTLPQQQLAQVTRALARGTVVVEAAARSGARNTASWADGLRRQVMGVPGPVTEAASQGVHQMIREGMATLVTGADDVLELLGVAGEHLIEAPRGPRRARDRLTLRQQQVLDAVPLVRFAPVDSIARTAGIGLVEVSAALRSLHGHGLVSESGDGWRLTELARA